MKKIIAALLALSLSCAFGFTAMAEETPASDEEIAVASSLPQSSTSNDEEGETSVIQQQATFNVEIVWKGMNFTYIAEKKGDWNPETCSYTEGEPGHWVSGDEEEGCGTITITNNSVDSEITATFSFTQDSSYKGRAIMRIADSKPSDAQGWKVAGYINSSKVKSFPSIASSNPKTIYMMPAIANDDNPELLKGLQEGKFGVIQITLTSTGGSDYNDPPSTSVPEIFE